MLQNRFCMLRSILVPLGVFCCSLFACSQTVPEPTPRIPVPESAFVSPHQYTNAFFGFKLLLPDDRHFQMVDLSESNKALQHFLFAEKSVKKGITLLIVSAIQVLGNPDEEAQKAAFLAGEQGAKAPEGVDIGGRLFWKNQTEQKTISGKVYRFRYATGLREFVLVFSVSAQDGRQADELRQNIESVKFFDPETAREVAGADSHPYLTDRVRHWLESAPQLDVARLDPGRLSGNVYSNPFLGFSYQFPSGWHAGQSSLEAANPNARRDSADSKKDQGLVGQCTRVLSVATKDPQEGHDDSFNPRIAMVAADPSCFAPDLNFPDSVHDEQAMELFGQALYRAFAGTAFLGRNASRLIAADLSGHVFLEMPSGSAIPVPGSTLLRKVHMSFVVTSLRGYWVIWLLESDTESELGRLLRTSISFVPPVPATAPGTH